MGFLSPSSSICYFQVNGTLDPKNKLSQLPEQLAGNGFRSIEQSMITMAVTLSLRAVAGMNKSSASPYARIGAASLPHS